MNRFPPWAVGVSAILVFVGALIWAGASQSRHWNPLLTLTGLVVAFAAFAFVPWRSRTERQKEFLSSQSVETREALLGLERAEYLIAMPSAALFVWLTCRGGGAWAWGRLWAFVDAGAVYYMPTHPGWLALATWILFLGVLLRLSNSLLPRLAGDRRREWLEFTSNRLCAISPAAEKRLAYLLIALALPCVLLTATSYGTVDPEGLTIHRFDVFGGTRYSWDSIERIRSSGGDRYSVRFADGSSWSFGGWFDNPAVWSLRVARYISDRAQRVVEYHLSSELGE